MNEELEKHIELLKLFQEKKDRLAKIMSEISEQESEINYSLDRINDYILDIVNENTNATEPDWITSDTQISKRGVFIELNIPTGAKLTSDMIFNLYDMFGGCEFQIFPLNLGEIQIIYRIFLSD